MVLFAGMICAHPTRVNERVISVRLESFNMLAAPGFKRAWWHPVTCSTVSVTIAPSSLRSRAEHFHQRIDQGLVHAGFRA